MRWAWVAGVGGGFHGVVQRRRGRKEDEKEGSSVGERAQ